MRKSLAIPVERCTWGQVFVFGFVHWIASYGENGKTGPNLVISFDFSNEVLHELMFQNSLA